MARDVALGLDDSGGKTQSERLRISSLLVFFPADRGS
jgi:hypothetical protein